MTLKKLLLATLMAGGMMSQANAQADIQIIHNCADPAAAVVDIYVNGTIALDNFEFRKATPFLSLPSGTTLNIGVAPGNSTSVNDTLVNIPVVLTQGEKYVAIASGVLAPASFSANPDGRPTGFELIVSDGIRTSALNPGEVDFKVLHGSTDAPTVDVVAQGVGVLVDDAAYTDFTGYINVPASDYLLDITPGNNNSIVVATFNAPLSALTGGAAVVFASGFLDPSTNQNGPAFGLFAALPNGDVLTLNQVGNARIQVIHNAADPAAATVDVYLNGALAIDDFDFREATDFFDITAGVEQNIGIAPGNSSSANDTLVNIPVTLNIGETYVAVANGVLNPANFTANPEGISTAFRLLLFTGMQEAAQQPGNVDVAVLHGATDAPAVDVVARNIATLVDSLTYTNLAGYLNLPAADYILDITPASGSPILLSYEANLSGLAGGAAVVFASGFLDPAANQNGEAFGLYAALPDGTVLPLNPVSSARLQVIHNAADPAAVSVDVYINGNLELDNFNFRTATPYIDVPAGVVLNIGIAPGSSSSVNDTLVNIPVTLNNGETYVAIANGVLNPASFASNPDGRPTAFQLLLFNGMREGAINTNEVDFRALHGATDAPAVDVVARNVATVVGNASYTDFTGYVSVPSQDYILDVKPAGTSTIVASFAAPLSAVPGQSAVVFASGFLDPAINQNGEAFGLFAALPNGTVVPFAATSLARLQVIHNCADPVADSVDVYINGTLSLDNFAFRTATPYIDVNGDVTINIGIAPKNSASVNDTLVNFPVVFKNGETYTAIASGVLSPASFAANPDGRPTGFTLLLEDGSREEALNANEVDVRVIHGSTDAPTVDVVVPGAGVVVDNAAYTDFTGYLNLAPASYTLQITPGNNNSVIVAAYTANLSGISGSAITVFASGFLDPTANQNGPAFGLYATLADGVTFPLPVATGLGEMNNELISSIFPNPAQDMINVSLPANVVAEAIQVSDISGKVVLTLPAMSNANQLAVNVSSLQSGTYFLNVVANNQVAVKRFSIVR